MAAGREIAKSTDSIKTLPVFFHVDTLSGVCRKMQGTLMTKKYLFITR